MNAGNINGNTNSVNYNFLMLFFITFVTFVINNDACYEKTQQVFNEFLNLFLFIIPKRNSIILEGKRCLKVTSYLTKTDNLFSNRFNAFWYFISKNNLKNKTIYCVKEYCNNNLYDDYGVPINNRRINDDTGDNRCDDEDRLENNDILIVDQLHYFKISKNIYCKVLKNLDKSDDKRMFETENISIELYSYTLSIYDLKEFLDKLDNDYRKSVEEERNNKKFIYSLIGNPGESSYDREIKRVWEECEFKSTRRFNNLFFENKDLLLKKLDFFIENEDWYDYEGHPYTFGIGLHGPPGTGKTSVIKCIANKLNRHIIVIPLSKIKTQREFSEYFFEQYYTRNNNKKIGFNDKIIVFEDIDCMTDIVKKRTINCSKINENSNKRSDDNSDSDSGENIKHETLLIDQKMDLQNKLLNKIAKKVDEDHQDTLTVDIDKTKDDKITLSFILNIIDGIRETPGRILIITSNNYNSLDPALIRPGRIDMTLEMKNASKNVIKEMYYHYYNDLIPHELDVKLKNYVLSPAKIVNMRLENREKADFLFALENEFL